MIGAVEASIRGAGHHFDDTKRYVDAIDGLSETDRTDLFRQRAQGVSKAREEAELVTRMSEQTQKQLRFGSSWQTQFRITQAIGRGLAELLPVQISVLAGLGNLRGLETGDVDLIFTKSVVNEHRYSGKGIHAGPQPDRWLRTIAWIPQEDRMLFAVAPWIDAETFEDLAAKRPPLKMAAQRSVNPVLKLYGFSLEDIEAWGGTVGSMHHTAQAARERFQRGQLDACFGDGSEYDGSAWLWMAEHGYRFLGLRPDVMDDTQHIRLRRNVTPAGFLPGIDKTLLAMDDSHIVLTCHERLDEDLAYARPNYPREQAGNRVQQYPGGLG